VDHVALNRPRTDNRHFNHQVIKATRLETRQHRHLRPTLDLKHTDGIRLADHVVNRRILGRDRGQIQRLSRWTGPLIQHVQGSPDRAEHPQAQAIHLQQPQRIEVNGILTGGDGSDTISYANTAAAVNVNLLTKRTIGGDGNDTLATIENVIGSQFSDTITGDLLNNLLDGGDGILGNDTILGGGGIDSIINA
jgi:hypothetical protein